MSDENNPTSELSPGEMFAMILNRLGGIETRLTALETAAAVAAEDRTRETRPKLDQIIRELSETNERMASIERSMARVEQGFSVLTDDMIALRGQQKAIERRLVELERTPN
jgi:septal ring factor EnvC (AmiA/AmiB activator)